MNMVQNITSVFCDDIFILGESKRDLWKLRDKLHYEAAQIGLTIKPSEKVLPYPPVWMPLALSTTATIHCYEKRTKVNASPKTFQD